MTAPYVREEFEKQLRKVFGKKSNFTRASDGGYQEQLVEKFWSIFKKGFRIGCKYHAPRKERLGKPYVIGKKVGYYKHIFSVTPMMHNRRMEAIREAERLTQEHGEEFVVFGRVLSSSPIPKEEVVE